MEVVRLTAQDYEEWLNVLNTVFSKQNKRNMEFERELPKMCVKDDAHMGMHLAVKEDGKICALLGIYPLKTRIGEKELLFSTVGNVATLPEQEGKGYMKVLMKEAMLELERIGADASRLGGGRQRYNRYGYEASGMNYYFTIDAHTTKHCEDQKNAVVFKKIGLQDEKELQFIEDLRKKQAICVERSYDDSFAGAYAVLRAWNNDVYVAMEGDDLLGYMSVSQSGEEIAEIDAKDLASLKDMLFGWQKKLGRDISFSLAPTEVEAVRYFSSVSADMLMRSPSHFKILSFDKVADALLKVKASCTPKLAEGEGVITIQDWGNLRICHKNGTAFCEKTETEGSLVLDKLAATRLLFGPFAVNSVMDADPFLAAVLPLPLSWSTLDRV